MPTAYTRTHMTRQQQQVAAFAFSIIGMANPWDRGATFWPLPATLA
ncbi:MAG TPA: hypothetical protein VJU82_00945 [Acidobacteriaceae bacterium]|nr:hypothetical protein [Acidobacteriaceae bacterium]